MGKKKVGGRTKQYSQLGNTREPKRGAGAAARGNNRKQGGKARGREPGQEQVHPNAEGEAEAVRTREGRAAARVHRSEEGGQDRPEGGGRQSNIGTGKRDRKAE